MATIGTENWRLAQAGDAQYQKSPIRDTAGKRARQRQGLTGVAGLCIGKIEERDSGLNQVAQAQVARELGVRELAPMQQQAKPMMTVANELKTNG